MYFYQKTCSGAANTAALPDKVHIWNGTFQEFQAETFNVVKWSFKVASLTNLAKLKVDRGLANVSETHQITGFGLQVLQQ